MSNVFRRLSLLAIAVCVLGLPLNRWMDIAALTFISIVIFCTHLNKDKFIKMAGILFIAISLKAFIPTLHIQEGHNIFLYQDDRESIFENNLPKAVFSIFKQEFESAYPKENTCSEGGCWRLGEGIKEVYAWSADGIWSNPVFSRVVDRINFTGLLQLRLGANNNPKYNFFPDHNDIKRDHMPYFVRYNFPPDAIGGDISFKGTIIWEEDNQFSLFSTSSLETKKITNPSTTIYAIDANSNEPLSLKFTPPFSWWILQILKDIIVYGSIAFVVCLFGRNLSWPDIKIPVISIIAGLFTIVVFKSNLIMGLAPQGGGADGLIHEGYGRLILQSLLEGNYYEALRGGESVYYFMPGLRYFYAIQKLLFGETNYGFVLLGLFYGVIVYNFLRLFLSPRWAFGTFLIFELTPLLGKFGLALPLYIKRIEQGLSEPLGNGLFMIATTFLFKAFIDKKEPLSFYTYFSFLLYALSIFIRPQLCIPVAILMLFSFYKIVLQEKRYMELLAPTLGLLPVFLITYHNWYFGHEFVPLTAADMIPETLPTPPITYFYALQDFLTGHWQGSSLHAVIDHLYNWNKGREFFRLLPFAIFIYMTFRKKTEYWLRTFCMMGLSMHIVLMFYLPAGRYAYLAWSFTFVVFLNYLEKELIPALQARRISSKPQVT